LFKHNSGQLSVLLSFKNQGGRKLREGDMSQHISWKRIFQMKASLEVRWMKQQMRYKNCVAKGKREWWGIENIDFVVCDQRRKESI
jgi:hypothetical protein